jgi:hypothetical protein
MRERLESRAAGSAAPEARAAPDGGRRASVTQLTE